MGRRRDKTEKIRELQAQLKASPSESKQIIADLNEEIKTQHEAMQRLDSLLIGAEKRREAAENVVSGMKLEMEKLNSIIREKDEQITKLTEEVEALKELFEAAVPPTEVADETEVA